MSTVPALRARIVVTGIGAITPLGATAEETWQNVLGGASAVRDWDDLEIEGHRAIRACRITDFDAPETRRGRALAIRAAREALTHSGRGPREDANAGGVFIGSTIGESAAFEQVGAGARIDLSDYTVPSFCAGVANELNLTGPREALATACAAGNYAIGAAALALRQNRVAWAIAGGVEPFSKLSMVGFARSRAMANGDCKPFDARRTGMLLGEGAAMLVLERLDDALSRGVTPLAEVCGLGLSSDAHHPTAPRPDGRGMARAMRLALQEAGVEPSQVDWVNVHGTGTRASDGAEGRALREVFDGVPMPVLSGSKGALGHALGAASAIEAMLCVSGLLDQQLPPTAGHDEVDPEIGIACTRERVVRTTMPVNIVMNNAFAFGGLNSTLVLRRWEAA